MRDAQRNGIGGTAPRWLCRQRVAFCAPRRSCLLRSAAATAVMTMRHFAALMLFGAPLAMVVVAVGSTAGYTVLKHRRRDPIWLDLLFNPSKGALSVAAGGAIYYAIIPAHAPTSFDDVRQVVALPAMATVMYLVNSFPACVAAGLQHGKKPLRLWLNGGGWMLFRLSRSYCWGW